MAKQAAAPAPSKTKKAASPKKVEKEKKRRVKKEKDPNAPKKALSAYMHFFKSVRPEIVKKLPELASKVTEVAKLIGDRWKAASEKEKAPFVTLAEKDKVRYEKELEKYTKAPAASPAKKSKK